jgi:uncharacterized protein (TIGR00162 family)
MVVEIEVLKRVKVKNGIFIEGMPGFGNIGQIVAGYLIEELKPQLFAKLYTSHFDHVVLIGPDGVVRPLAGYFYFFKPSKLIIYYGDQQALTPQGTFELVNKILKFIKEIGVKFVITVGGVATPTYKESRKVYGAVSDAKIKEKFKNLDIDFESAGQNVGSIIGAVGLLTAYSKKYGMESLCLLAESPTLPYVPDQKGAKAVLEILLKILNIKLDLSKIEKKVKEQEELFKKIMKREKAVEKEEKEKEEKRLSYLG